ncbi:MAG: putative ABC transporter ATP-binding protein YbiT [Chlamydiia bacterium]|nr:putative ABC transporter ATP-binding protein YbiT [Chlamydiia bacterium]
MSRLLIQYTHLYKSFDAQILFEDISLTINEGELFALVGKNGTGKTTLLQILAGSTDPSRGNSYFAEGLRIAYLPQEVILEDGGIVAREYMEDASLSLLEKKMAECLKDECRLEEWEKLHEKYESLGGYDRPPLEKILHGLKLDALDLDKRMSDLSSGQRLRVALAKTLIYDPDLLLLDEPTNHLDKDMIIWLTDTLKDRNKKGKGAVVIVSHDRAFLNATCNRLIEISCAKLNTYIGSYDFYIKEKERELADKLKAYEDYKEEVKSLKMQIKAITFTKGKPVPPKDNNIMAYDRRGDKHQKSVARNVNDLKTRLELLEENAPKHPKPKTIKGLRFSQAMLPVSCVIACENISKSFDNNTLFNNVSKTLNKGDRIVLTGKNGCGKTTFLKCMANMLEVDSGEVRITSRAKIAYLDQEVELLPMDKTPRMYFEDRYQLSEEDLRKELHKAAIGGEELLHLPFSNLSVGQRKRLMLLSLILEKPTVLLLDEPTNHLDLATVEALEKALLEFDGALLAISHDKMFIKKIATDVWEL